MFVSFVRRVGICTLSSHSRGLPQTLVHLTLSEIATRTVDETNRNRRTVSLTVDACGGVTSHWFVELKMATTGRVLVS